MLAARARVADTAVEEAFPELSEVSLSATDAEGYFLGTRLADLADLGPDYAEPQQIPSPVTRPGCQGADPSRMITGSAARGIIPSNPCSSSGMCPDPTEHQNLLLMFRRFRA